MVVSYLGVLPRSCAEAVNEATFPKIAQVFSVLPAEPVRFSPSWGPAAPNPAEPAALPRAPLPARNKGIPSSPETFETQENRTYRENRGLEDTPPTPRGFPRWLLPPPGSPATPRLAQTDGDPSRSAPSPVPILRGIRGAREQPGRGGRQGTASSHAAAGAPSGEQRREPAGPSPHTPRRQHPPWELRSLAKSTDKKKKDTLFLALLNANALFESLHSPPFA